MWDCVQQRALRHMRCAGFSNFSLCRLSESLRPSASEERALVIVPQPKKLVYSRNTLVVLLRILLSPFVKRYLQIPSSASS